MVSRVYVARVIHKIGFCGILCAPPEMVSGLIKVIHSNHYILAPAI